MRPSGPEFGSGDGVAIEVGDLSVAYRDKVVLRCPRVVVRRGTMLAVVGPNGAGKSTLLKAILGVIPVRSGRIEVLGASIDRVRDRVAYVPQRESVDWDFPVTALEVVTMGLYRRIGWLRPVRRRHRELALGAMERLGVAEFAHRPISDLSGGQQQRVFLARALVQDADVILLDEPLAGVDTATSEVVLDLLATLRRSGRTIVAVLHGLDIVRERFDEALLLNVEPLAFGPVATTLTPEALAVAYGGPLAAVAAIAEHGG